MASSASNANADDKTNDLSLGFNAGPTPGPTIATPSPMWPTSSRAAALGYGLPPEMGMFVVAPATSFHHSQHESLIPGDSHGLGVGVIPLLTAAPCINPSSGGGAGGGAGGMDGDDLVISRGNRTAGAIQLQWQQNQHHHHQQQHHQQNQQQQQQQQHKNTNTINFNHHHHHHQVVSANLLGGGGSSSGGTATCQDCGNQAKKDCSHRRCRTCCRSRGFDCSTHVKSTWVPAARRRERQMMGGTTTTTGAAGGGGGGGGGASSGSTSGAKKPRLISSQNTATTSHTSTSNTPPRSFDTSSSHQEASFKETLPGQVRAPAVFKCVRVTAVDDGEDEFAYQAVVKIGGHVFKGFLYDQGAEPREGFPNLSELHLGGGGGSSGGGGGRNGGSSSSPILDPSEVYGATAAGTGSLLGVGGSSYGNTIN